MITRGIAELLALAAAAVTSVWVSRIMGPEYLGLFAVAATILAFAQVLADAGLPSLGAQLIVNEPEVARKVWIEVSRIRAIGAGVAAFAEIVALVGLDVQPPLRVLLGAAVLAITLIPLNSNYVLVAVGSVHSVAIVRTISAVATMGIAVIFIRTPSDVAALASLLVVPGITAGLGSSLLIWRAISPGRDTPVGPNVPSSLRSWYRHGFAYAKADLSLLVYMSADRLILAITSGVATVGVYEAAVRLIQPFYALSTVIRESMFVDLARALTSVGSDTIIRRWARLMFVATIPVGPFLTLYSAWVINLVYGPSFSGAIAPLLILGWAITIGFVSGAIVLPFLSWNLGREYGNAVLSGNITNLIGNVLLAPLFGAVGSALATVAAKVAVTITGWRSFKRATEFPMLRLAARYLLVSLVALGGSAVALLASNVVVVGIAAFAVSYVVLVLMVEATELHSSSALRSET